MQVLNQAEIHFVSGGDAAATRQPGQNSWGESQTKGSDALTPGERCQWDNALGGGGIVGWLLCKIPIFQ